MSLEFIKDVIYGLKREYGTPVILKKIVENLNIPSGQKTQTTTEHYLAMAIALPLDRRDAFLKSVGIHKAAYVELNQRQYLIDKDDLYDFEVVINDKLEDSDGTHDVKLVETYSHALIVTCSTVP